MQFDNPTTNRIPIIIDKEELVVSKVKKLLKLHIEKRQNESQKIMLHIKTKENELNQLFYRIFNLTDNEIIMIEKSTPR